MLDRPGRARVAAVITAFAPSDDLVQVCRSVVDQVDLVVVVDDGSPTPPSALLDECRALGALVEVHERNLGIGAALNTGTAVARAADPGLGTDDEAYLLTLDQDSTVPPGYVAALVDARRRASAQGVRVGLVGPARVQGIGSMVRRETDGVVEGREPIQSGLLVPWPVLEELGPFDADLFIDSVDSEYYLRATTRGLVTVVAPGAALGHQLGSAHPVAGTAATPRLVHAATFRYYYIARNRVNLLRRYGRTAPGWCVRAVGKDVRHLLVTTVLVPGRRARWAATFAGLRDGFAGVTGRRPEPR